MRSLLSFAATAALIGAAASQSSSSPIKYVIFMELENRAFDHMLGWLSRNNSQIRGLTGQEYNYLDPFNTSSPKFFVDDQAAYVDPDPGHGVPDTAQQIYGRTWGNLTVEQMNGFVANAVNNTGADWASHIMKCFSPQDVPVISTLAMEFALIDAFHAGIPGPTYPNRLYSASATSYGYGDNDLIQTIEGWPQKSIFGALNEVNVPWRVYMAEASTAWLLQDARGQITTNYKFVEDFAADVAAGDLPPFTWIDPGYFDFLGYNASDQHPSHDVAVGERFVKGIYEALRASPIWNESVLIYTYDEHGGFYDSVAPPTQGVPNPDGRPCVDCGNIPFNFDRLGIRIPALVISPWIPKGTVIHSAPADVMPTSTSQFELSSLPATIHSVFNTTSFLNARDAWANPLNWIWERSPLTAPRTDCPTVLPSPPTSMPGLKDRKPASQRGLSGLQQDLLYLTHGALGISSSVAEVDAARARLGLTTEEATGIHIRNAVARAMNRPDKMVRPPLKPADTIDIAAM